LRLTREQKQMTIYFATISMKNRYGEICSDQPYAHDPHPPRG